MAGKEEHLFPKIDSAKYGDNRRKRPLFLPHCLKRESQVKRLEGAAQDKAYEIILKWADLESSGKLQKEKETSLEPEFLTQIFGQALGYTLFSEGKEQWNLKPKFNVNGGEADAAIGLFQDKKKSTPIAVIEFKSPTVNLDRDKFNGRTAVQQCWDYLSELPECPWGIVCNYVSFRLYHRNYTTKVYELFTLQDLRKKEIFLQFYCLLERHGLLPMGKVQRPRAETLLEETSKREREVGDELYKYYHDNRLKLIQHLCGEPHNKSLEKAIRVAQKLIDRIIFVAFCEDRDLLPQNSIYKAWNQVAPFHRVTNPKWQNFLALFRSIDEGNEPHEISPYNGGLFRKDDEVDELDLDDEWTNFFKHIGGYDFRHEINVDILGHLFEKSINDIERIRLGGLFESKNKDEILPKMAKSAERKRGGIYYTPPEFTEFITNHTVTKIADAKLTAVAQHYGIDPQDSDLSKHDGKIVQHCLESVETLRKIKIIDPACGSGHFLIQSYDVLEEKYLDTVDTLAFHDANRAEELKEKIPDFILHDNLFGVDLSPEAVEITQLALWLRSAQRGKTLADLSQNIICGNSLVTDPKVDSYAIDWENAFPEIFSRQTPGFDCVIGNPPWERIKLQEREFFDAIVPNIATAVNAAIRRKLISKLQKAKPELHQRYIKAKTSAEKTLAHVRNSGQFPLTGKGDINTYAVFAELAHRIVAPNGLVGLLVPTGIATEHTTRQFFRNLTESKSLYGLYDFENLAPIFPDVHRSYKFCILLFAGSQRKTECADFVFFAHRIEDLKEHNRHISLSSKDFKLLNPNTRTCPIFRSNRDAELTKTIYQRVPLLKDKNRKEGGNPWGVKFFTIFHQTNDSELFHVADQLKAAGFSRDGVLWKKGKKTFLPLYEAKMFRPYDHRFASVYIKPENWMIQGQTMETTPVEHQNPEFSVEPRWWADQSEISKKLDLSNIHALIAFRNITRATDSRTVLACFIPKVGVINSAPLILFNRNLSLRLQCCLLADLNSFVLDYVAKQKIAHINLNFFIIEQFPIFSPAFYSRHCPWDNRQTLENWISERVLKLTCTSNDMIPLAKAAKFEPPVHKWNPTERLDLQAQLDAAFFLLYGIKQDDVEYILSTFSGVRKEPESMFSVSNTLDRILKHYHSLGGK